MTYSPGYSDVTASISIAANATSSGLCTSLGGASTFMFQLAGTWTATVQAQITRDGTNWVNVTGSNMIVNAATGAYVSAGNVTASGIYQVDVTGCAAARVITTAYTSGTITGSACLSQTDAVVAIEGTPTVAVSTATPVTPLAYILATAASTNAAAIKASAGTLYAVVASNPTASPVYWKFYNKTTAPTVGTDVPVVTIAVPANTTLPIEFGAVGLRFTTGMSSAVTGAMAATDTTVATAGIQLIASYL